MAERCGRPIVRIAELEIDAFQLDSFRALLAEEIEASVQNEPGVLFLHAVSIKGFARNGARHRMLRRSFRLPRPPDRAALSQIQGADG